MNTSIKVSIIIPIYNVSLYIERCLISALNQTYPSIEYILVDDASPDDSMHKAQKKIDASSRKKDIHILHHEQNKGLSAARNSGIKKASGEYVYFMDSDDELPADCIETLISFIGKGDPDFVIGEIKVINGKRKNYTRLSLKNKQILNDEHIIESFLQKKWYEMAWNKLVNREFILKNNLWFYEGLIHEDNLWSFTLALKAKKMIVVRKETYYYYINQQSISQSKNEKSLNHTLLVMNHIMELSRNKEINIKLLGAYLNDIRIYTLKCLMKFHFSDDFKTKTKKELDKIFNDPFLSSWKMPVIQKIKYQLISIIGRWR